MHIISYNSFGGTTYSYEFELRSGEGFDAKSLNKETEYVKNNANNAGSFSSQTVSSVFGKGTLIQSDYILLIGSISRNFSWKEGVFQTDNLDVLRIADSESGVWFLLPSSNLSIKNQNEENGLRVAKLNLGTLRVKASGNRNDTDEESEEFKYKMRIETPEVKVTIPRGGDAVIIREKGKNGVLYSKVLVFSGVAYLEPSAKNLQNPEQFKGKKFPWHRS